MIRNFSLRQMLHLLLELLFGECDAMRCDAMRCDAMRCDAMRCDAMRCDAMRCDAMRYIHTYYFFM